MSELKKKYSEQLGMNASTAQNRLVKDLLFHLVVETGANTCFQCGDPMTREDFTIEHKIPWRHSLEASALFFDLDNVAFSHYKCNVAAARRPTKESDCPDICRETKNAKARAAYKTYMETRTAEDKLRDKKARHEAYIKYGC